MKTLGIVAWPGRSERLQEALERVAAWGIQHPRIRILALDSLRGISAGLSLAKTARIRASDALIAIGGDGTVLSAARLTLGREIPLLGINTGRIGFLAEYRVDSLEEALDLLVTGNYRLCPRIMLDFRVRQGRKILMRDTSLNEVQVQAVDPEHMVDLEVSLNGQRLTEYWADSLLVSTPTGSTAYNLSAGGPILHPATPAFILNPVNPFSLAVRPLVIPAENVVLTLRECNGHSLRIWSDGRPGAELGPGQILELRKSRWGTSFVQPIHTGFVDALREKLGWTGKPRPKP
ncbi:MAG TPA: NAD(+)/NADH kinase [Fibrobacteraceae bacterium]|nr:NAD(+)/NADH kinase [Fibrobacteraceae bacterium]